LDEIDYDAQHGDHKDDGRVGSLADDNRDDAGDQTNDDEGIEEQQ